ncbi:MAG: hypothetical protein QME47_00485 [Candidatus Thermoplasmatota archaeon]|nr:hypothetical protein [Candidatus Thermoplasmatota archaeon]
MRKMRLVALLLLCLAGVLVLSAIVGVVGNEEVGAKEVKSVGVEKGLTEHEPILIDGNENFTAENGVSNPSAEGTESDPYIIENWDIDASTANGIEIRDTTK